MSDSSKWLKLKKHLHHGVLDMQARTADVAEKPLSSPKIPPKLRAFLAKPWLGALLGLIVGLIAGMALWGWPGEGPPPAASAPPVAVFGTPAKP